MTRDLQRIPEGTRIDDHVVVDLLGAGSMGAVYRVRCPGTGRLAAMKILDTTGRDEAHRARVRREVEIQGAVHHPNLLAVETTGVVEGGLYLVMPIAPDGSLEDRLAADRPDDREACRVLIAIATGLEHLHGRGVAHRDLKPSNVLLGPGDAVRIAGLVEGPGQGQALRGRHDVGGRGGSG